MQKNQDVADFCITIKILGVGEIIKSVGWGVNRKSPCEIMYGSQAASQLNINIRRKVYIAVDRKPQNNIWFSCS